MNKTMIKKTHNKIRYNKIHKYSKFNFNNTYTCTYVIVLLFPTFITPISLNLNFVVFPPMVTFRGSGLVYKFSKLEMDGNSYDELVCVIYFGTEII